MANQWVVIEKKGSDKARAFGPYPSKMKAQRQADAGEERGFNVRVKKYNESVKRELIKGVSKGNITASAQLTRSLRRR